MSTNTVTRAKKIRKSSNIFEMLTEMITNNKVYEENELYNVIEAAKKEWNDSLNFFNNVTEPELVDYAIHMIDAAESKYMYLLNQARKECYSVNLTKIL